jgi:hypothetical protein
MKLLPPLILVRSLMFVRCALLLEKLSSMSSKDRLCFKLLKNLNLILCPFQTCTVKEKIYGDMVDLELLRAF